MFLSVYRTFVKIVETGSLAATARELHLSPSAVSKQLAALEQRLGATLIQRSTRSIQVTAVGQQFYRRCLEIIESSNTAESEVRDWVGEQGGTVRITLPQALATAEFSQLLQSFRRAQPNISLDIRVSNAPYNLIDNNLDVAFRAGNLKDSRLVAIELFRSQVIMCASADYLRERGAPQTPEDLHRHTLLVPSQHYLPAPLNGPGEYSSDNHILCDDLGMLIELTKQGAGLGLLLEHFAQEQIERGALLTVQSPLAHQARPFNMIYLSRDYMPRRVLLFLEHIKGHYGKSPL